MSPITEFTMSLFRLPMYSVYLSTPSLYI